jgi:glycolate oxidase
VRLSDQFVAEITGAAGRQWVRSEPEALAAYAADALGRGHPPDLVVLPATTADVSAIARACSAHRVPMVVRGAGTGYTGGAVPTRGGLVVSLERMNRILEVDETNLLAVVEPNVITGDLQRAVEQVGLFYPPDPASLDRSSIGGNVAECAGGPRAFKYGTTKRYVLALEAVLPSGEIIRTGSKAVKNVVGYDLTQLLVGSEGTLAIITQVTLRLIPKPAARATLAAAFVGMRDAVSAVTGLIARRVTPAAIELVDRASLEAVEAYAKRAVVPAGCSALLIVECDGWPGSVRDEMAEVEAACRAAGSSSLRQSATEAEREELWSARRDLSLALRATGRLKINHDVVVPRGRVPQLIDAVEEIARHGRLQVASFGHAGDGNIHVNVMVDPADAAEVDRARQAERTLFERVVALEGSISGEHGIGFTKAAYLPIELSADTIAVMKRVKAAFDPHDLLNPGKIFP